jgi:hypothetical protein
MTQPGQSQSTYIPRPRGRGPVEAPRRAGFLFAWRTRPWMSIALLLIMEIGCALWVRDNLTLNVIMLIHPVEAIKHWQSAGHGM